MGGPNIAFEKRALYLELLQVIRDLVEPAMHELPEYSSALGPPITKAPLDSCRWWSGLKKLCQSSHVTPTPFQQEIVVSTI